MQWFLPGEQANIIYLDTPLENIDPEIFKFQLIHLRKNTGVKAFHQCVGKKTVEITIQQVSRNQKYNAYRNRNISKYVSLCFLGAIVCFHGGRLTYP